MKLICRLALVALFAGIGWFAYNEYNFRQVHGRVVDIGTVNFNQEVLTVSDQFPVVIFLYDGTVNNDQQFAEVASFAWWNARSAKVVSMDCSKWDTKGLGFGLLVFRYPSFVIVYKNETAHGHNGTLHSRTELERLLEQTVRQANQQAPKKTP